MHAAARRRFGRYYKEERLRLDLTQATVLNRLAVEAGCVYEGSFLSKVEAGRIVRLERPQVLALVRALRTDGIRGRALLAAADYTVLPAGEWERCLALGYLASVSAPLLGELAGLARQAVAAADRGDALPAPHGVRARLLSGCAGSAADTAETA